MGHWTRRQVMLGGLALSGSFLWDCQGPIGTEPAPNEPKPQEPIPTQEAVSTEPTSEPASPTDAAGPDAPDVSAPPETTIGPDTITCDNPFDPAKGARFVGVVPFINEGGRTMDTLYGSGWDGRLYTDLSNLTPENPKLPTELFFVRTRTPDSLPDAATWSIRLDGLVEAPVVVPIKELLPQAKAMGEVLLECSGNGKGGKFGLLGAATWGGIPLEQVLQRAKAKPSATRVLIEGYDKHSTPSTHSTPGASWIFSFEQLKRFGAFLATDMNGAPLTKEHGAPVRLVMPRWYGCTNIKWVQTIRFVDETEPSTAQMKEFASRTHQVGVPALAKDFRPASMDQSAMVTRIERWTIEDKPVYRVIGIMWGGASLTSKLEIRFRPSEIYVPVTVCPAQETNNTWTFWTHTWRPLQKGDYQIQLQVNDPKVPTNRLDQGFYNRETRIDVI